ncbi:MAG: hypothetical protein JWO19_4952 [Bryobacterales bacterium]|nr:hypothetical protein [Bryobacterales bacterium]
MPPAQAAFSVRSLTLLLFLLIPSAAYLWHFADVPRFGDLHDDSLYFVSAKSLADGGGYRIESLPGEPPQTKYPPLYPLLLSVAWRLDPQFPGNLQLAAWISWLALPAVLLLMAVLYPSLGISRGRAWLLLFLFAANPYVIVFSTQLLSEMLFLALSLAAMLLAERAAKASSSAAVAAGAVAGLAYLTRSAGLALLVAAVIYLWPLRKQRRSAMLFTAAMLPFVAAWILWARLHQTATTDPALIYYLDYFRYEIYSISLRDLHLILWKNVDGLLWGLGGLILPKVINSLFLKILAEVLAIAMISGVVRLVRRGIGTLYALFAIATTALLVIWHFPPNERFVLPLLPLALAGLLTEADHLAGMLRTGLRHHDRGQRVVAAGFSAAVLAIAAGCLVLQLFMDASFLPADALQHRMRKIQNIAVYGWIRAKAPADASFLAADDAVLFLYTGHHAMSKPLPPALWYRQDRAGMIAWLTDLAPFARDRGLTLLHFAGVDARQGIADDDRDAIEKAIRSSPDLSLLYRTETAAVHRFH